MSQRVENIERAERRGYGDAQRGLSRNSVPYVSIKAAQAWEVGYDRWLKEAKKTGQIQTILRRRK